MERALNFQELFESRAGARVVTDRHLCILAVSDSFAGHLGTTRSELVGKNLAEVFPGFSTDSEVQKATLGHSGVERATRRTDGSVCWLRWHPLEGQESLFIFEDVTECKLLEAAYRSAGAKMLAVFESLLEGIVFVNRAGEREEITAPFIDPSGIESKPAKIHTSVLADVESGGVNPVEQQPALLALRTGQPVRNLEIAVPGPHGQILWHLVNAQPVYDTQRVLLGAVASYYDITAQKKTEESLRESEQRYRTLFEAMTESVSVFTVVYDGKGNLLDLRYLAVNPAFERQTGLQAAQVVNRTFREVFPRAEEVWSEALRKVALTGEPRRFEEWFSPLEKWFQVIAFRINPERVALTFTDVTERREAIQKLYTAVKEVEDIKAAVDEHAIVVVTNARGEITYVNDKFCQVSGYSRAELLGQNPRMLNSQFHPKEYFAELWSTIRAGKTWHGEIRNRAKNGTYYWLDTTIFPILDDLKRPVQYVALRTNVTARKELEKRILEVTDREQNRIGQDLHDGLCQHLAGIEFRLLALKLKLARRSRKLAGETDELARLVREAIEQTRHLAHGLSPVMLAPEGLMNALQELALNTEKSFAMECDFECPKPVLIQDNATATHLYRIAQEAVHNAVRHGQAKKIQINLVTTSDRTILCIKDNGVGFSDSSHKTGLGLKVMQYRAAMINGSLVVQKEPDGGVSVICSLRHSPEAHPPRDTTSGGKHS